MARMIKAVVDIEAMSAEEGAVRLVRACHGLARDAGWWTDLETGEERKKPVPEALMLIVTEVSEAMEGWRKGLASDKIEGFTALEEELADALIRICDFAGGYELRLAEAVAAKLRYNATRADHKPENRRKTGGKRV